MRRISLALALVGAAAVTGCMSGAKAPAGSSDSGVQKGVTGSYYFVNIFQPPVGGIITSDVGGINCGASAQAVSGASYVYTYYSGASACGTAGQTQFAWSQVVTLTATPQGGNAFIGWAGDCSGIGACTLDTSVNGADKTVVAIFGPPGGGHGNFMDPAVHGAALRAGVLKCAQCHGGLELNGMSIAPACTSCHDGMDPLAAARPENCANCHETGALSAGPAHAISGKTTWTVTPVVADATTTLKFTVNVKVDGVGQAGLTNGNAYRYAYNAARESASVVAAYERFSLTNGTQVSVVDNGSGNYTVNLIGFGPGGSAELSGNQTFAVRLQSSATPGPTVVYATPVAHFNGPARDLVSNAACVNCHDAQVFRHREANGEWHHGANPYGVEACVVCHTRYGSVSRGMGGDRLTAYVHGVHNSHDMPARNITANLVDPADGVTKPFTVSKPDGVYARNDSLRIVAGSSPTAAEISSPWSVGFPGYLVNCSICHDTPARLNAIMAMSVTSSTCFSCHDNWNGFPSFVDNPASTTDSYDKKVAANPNWLTAVVAPHMAIPLPAASTAAASTCMTAGCHDGTAAFNTVGGIHTLRITERNGVVYKGQDLSISEGEKLVLSVDSVTYGATTLTVTWSAKLNGNPVDPCNTSFAAGPVFMGATADAPSGRSASNMSLLQAYAQGNDWVNAGVGTSAGQPSSAPTLVMTNPSANGYTTCAANVATSSIARPASGAATKGVVGLQGKPQIQYTDGSFTRIIQLRSTSPVKEFAVGAAAAEPVRRQIVSNDKCLACHPGSLYQHGGNRVDSVDLCVMCHNPASSENSTRVAMGVDVTEAADGKFGETIDMRTMIHAIHSAGETNVALVYYRTQGVYAFGSQAAIDALPNWPGAGCFPVFGSTQSSSSTGSQCDGSAVGSTTPTKKNHNEIVVHYPRALNDCSACHINGSEQGFGDQSQRVAVTWNSAGVSPWGNQLDDVLRGAGAQSCMTCHQTSDVVRNTELRNHANNFGVTPQVFPGGRNDLLNFAKCGSFTCP